MKKEILIFGAVVVLCLGVTAFALMKPKAKPTTTIDSSSSSSSFASTGSGSSDYSLSGSSTSPGSLGSSDSFSSSGSSLYPPPADLNPNKPFDTGTGSTSLGSTSGTGSGTTGSTSLGSTGSLPPGNPFPGSSTSTSSGFGTTGGTDFGTSGSTGSSSSSASTSTSLSSATPGETRTHTVKKGEILGDISRKYYGSVKHWRKIAEANSVKEDGLKEGMKLTIPPLDVAPVTADATATTTGDAGTYVVKKGDSYYKIAKKELGDASRYKEIEKLNGIAAEDLHEGQKIKLPSRTTASTDAGAASGPEAPVSGRIHVVAEGEYLSDISKKYYGSTKHWQEIVKANPGVSPERLKVGQKLVIPELAGKAPTAGAVGETAVSSDEYVVKKGDTFEVIAGKTLGDKKLWKKIQDVNPGVDPSALKIGQKIKLPAGAKGSEPAAIPAPTAPALPGPAFPAPTSTFPSTTPTTTPGSAIPGPATTDPWAPLPPAGGTSTTSPTTGTGTTTTYSDPWKDFSTTTPTTSGTGTTTSP